MRRLRPWAGVCVALLLGASRADTRATRLATWADPVPGAAVDPRSRLPGVVVDRASGVRLVLVPGGRYMGRRVRAFYLGKYEVTTEEWVRVTGAGPKGAEDIQLRVLRGEELDPRTAEVVRAFVPAPFLDPRQPGPRHPVVGVSWDDIYSFLDPTGLRLPTELEWQYACVLGAAARGDIDATAWHLRNSGLTRHEVGTKDADALGIHDMLGNVAEWCNGGWSLDPDYDEPSSTAEWYHCSRGGSFLSGPRDLGYDDRAAQHRADRSETVGFRVARSP